MPTGHGEDVADEGRRSPVHHADPASGATDADEFIGDPLLVGSEHRPEGGHDHVEAVVVEAKALGVGHPGGQSESVGVRHPPGGVEQVVDEVGGGHLGPAAGGGQRGGAVPGGDVEDLLTGVHIEGLAQQLAVEDAARAEPGEVASAQVLCWRSVMAR